MSYANGPKIVTDGLVLCLDAANTKSVDPLMDDVSLLLHMDGTNGSTTFTDVSKNNLSFTANGNAQVSSSVGKFGSSAYFDGNGDYISNAGSTGFAFGTGPFTVEAWINCSSLPTTNNYAGIIGTYTTLSSASNDAWFLCVRNNGGTMTLWLQRHGDGNIYAYSNWTPSLNTWYHVAACRDSSGVIHLFVDGVKQSVTSSNNWSSGNFTRSGPIGIGVIATPYYFHGYIDEVRVIKGKALYTSSFSPQKKPYNNPNAFYDLSGSGNNGLVKNGAKNNNVAKGSMFFDGFDDYITIPYSSNLWLGDSNWTIQCWVRPNSFSHYGVIWDHGYGAPDTIRSIVIYINQNDGLIRIAQSPNGSTNYDVSLGLTLSTNTWQHLAIVRNNSTIVGYLNGIVGDTSITAYSLYNSTTRSHFVGIQGDFQSITDYDGLISNFSVYKNKALTVSEIQQNYNALKGRFENNYQPLATGGTETYIQQNGNYYKVHTFTNVGNSTLTFYGEGDVEYLIVGGGGGGALFGGGGGAGGLVSGNLKADIKEYSIVVGSGGSGSSAGLVAGGTGGDSSAFDMVAYGGGGGGSRGSSPPYGAQSGNSGGSGGGGSNSDNGTIGYGGLGTIGQGNSGAQGNPSTYVGAGGGGAGAAGTVGTYFTGNYNSTSNVGGKGGDGIPVIITGSSVYYAGGGGGSVYTNGSGGAGGLGGGGKGEKYNITPGNGSPNTGGGGGASGYPGAGGSGGSGIVIVRYQITQAMYEANT